MATRLTARGTPDKRITHGRTALKKRVDPVITLPYPTSVQDEQRHERLRQWGWVIKYRPIDPASEDAVSEPTIPLEEK